MIMKIYRTLSGFIGAVIAFVILGGAGVLPVWGFSPPAGISKTLVVASCVACTIKCLDFIAIRLFTSKSAK